MISAKRRALILEYLQREGAGSITRLSEMFDSSSSTIRRDLDALIESGYILRSYGGAVLKEKQQTTFEPKRNIGLHFAHEAKLKIGARAAAMLESGQSVIFDSSTTVLEVAKVVAHKALKLTACTNDLAIATVLSQAPSIQLVVLGGTVRQGSPTMTGDPGISFLSRLNADIAFIGIHSLVGSRLSDTSIDLATVKRSMVESAAHTVVLVDSSKFKHPAFCNVCDLRDVQTIITDAGVSPVDQDRLKDAGIELIVAT